MQVERTAHIIPWSEATIRDCLRVGYDCELASLRGVAVAFSIARTGPDDTELLNLCVHPGERRRGVGLQLLSSVLARARRAGSARVLLDVRESNSAAQALYAKSGFASIGFRPDYYRQPSGRREGAVVMSLQLDR